MFKLSIRTTNAAFEGDETQEIVRILRSIANKLEEGYVLIQDTNRIMDINGNDVGTFCLK